MLRKIERRSERRLRHLSLSLVYEVISSLPLLPLFSASRAPLSKAFSGRRWRVVLHSTARFFHTELLYVYLSLSVRVVPPVGVSRVGGTPARTPDTRVHVGMHSLYVYVWPSLYMIRSPGMRGRQGVWAVVCLVSVLSFFERELREKERARKEGEDVYAGTTGSLEHCLLSREDAKKTERRFLVSIHLMRLCCLCPCQRVLLFFFGVYVHPNINTIARSVAGNVCKDDETRRQSKT